MSFTNGRSFKGINGHNGLYPVPRNGQVIDIGGSQLTESLRRVFKKKLIGKDDQNRHFLCDSFFSDDEGLAIWKTVNKLPNYYQTNHEVELLERHGDQIVGFIGEGTVIIDMGCGDVRKVKPLLDRLEGAGKRVQYYALDLSKKAVEENMESFGSKYQHVECFGLWGTFEDGLKWSQTLPPQQPKIYLSLGSIFGNDRFDRAVKYLRIWADTLRPADRILLGIDGCQNKEEVWNSYHDEEGHFEDFVRNAFIHSNRILGPWYRHEDWSVHGILEENPLSHRFVLRAVNDVVYEPAGINFVAGDEIECYEGHKQPPAVMRKQFPLAGLLEVGTWESSSANIFEYLLQARESTAFKADGPIDDGFWG